ncbi:MAG: TraR/DksA family transcriptional regulator [Desulfuromonadales bacterium]
MSELTADRVAELHRALLDLRNELRSLLACSDAGARPVSLDQPIGRLSRMDALQQQSMTRANRRTAQTRLTRVEAALRRLTKGDYGWCVECEEEICYARLRAQPEAPFCLACQASREGKGS